jgi:hypothetical protein
MVTHTVLLLLLSFQLITRSLSQPQSNRDLPALIKIREQFGNPAALSGWRPGGSACAPPAACDERGRVTEIFLRGLDITSTLPPAIGELDQLETLSIENMPGLHVVARRACAFILSVLPFCQLPTANFRTSRPQQYKGTGRSPAFPLKTIQKPNHIRFGFCIAETRAG